METVNDNVRTSASDEENFEDAPEELALQNLVEEMKSVVELEREERVRTNLCVQIENMRQQYVSVEKSNCRLRKILLDSQTEIDRIRQEVKKPVEMVNEVCSEDRLQNFSEVLRAVTRVGNERTEVKPVLNNDIQKCLSYYLEINHLTDDTARLNDSIISLRKDQQNLANQVESIMTKLKIYLAGLSDEKIERLKEEFEKCLALKRDLEALEIEQRNTEEKLRQNVEKRKEVEAATSNSLKQFENWNSLHQNVSGNLHAEIEIISMDTKKLNLTDEYDKIQFALNGLKCELKNLRVNNETLKFQKRQYADEIALQLHQVSLKKLELKIKQDTMRTLESERDVEENAIQVLQNQVNELDENMSKMRSNFGIARKEIFSLEEEYGSFSCLDDEDVEAIQYNCDMLQNDFANSEREIADLTAEEKDLHEIVQKLATTVKMQRDSELTMDTRLMEELRRIKLEWENHSRQQLRETDQRINSHREDVNASAIDNYESDLHLDSLRRDSWFLKETYATKQFELWTYDHENERKYIERDELDKKLVVEKTNCDRTEDLLRDLRRNTIPKAELPEHPLFQLYLKESEEHKLSLKKREKLEQEKKMLSEKLEKYEYEKFRTRNVSQSLSDLRLNETENKEKPPKKT